MLGGSGISPEPVWMQNAAQRGRGAEASPVAVGALPAANFGGQRLLGTRRLLGTAICKGQADTAADRTLESKSEGSGVILFCTPGGGSFKKILVRGNSCVY